MKRLSLSALRPTQTTVGLDYVDARALITARYAGAARERFMLDHAIRIVMGPETGLISSTIITGHVRGITSDMAMPRLLWSRICRGLKTVSSAPVN